MKHGVLCVVIYVGMYCVCVYMEQAVTLGRRALAGSGLVRGKYSGAALGGLVCGATFKQGGCSGDDHAAAMLEPRLPMIRRGK